MSAAALSFRTSSEFADQTTSLAQFFNMPSSEYLRKTVRDKNERVLKAPYGIFI